MLQALANTGSLGVAHGAEVPADSPIERINAMCKATAKLQEQFAEGTVAGMTVARDRWALRSTERRMKSTDRELESMLTEDITGRIPEVETISDLIQ